MLEHLSPKFKMPPMEREPRAALILNRFTRNLSIMFATNAVSTILGLQPEEIKDKSFYECIQENCLQDAIQCLESAKANESIAYLRFSFRDPRTDDDDEERDHVSEDEEDHVSEDEEEDEDGEDDEEESNASTELDDQMDMDEDEIPVDIKGEDDLMVEDAKVAPPSTFRSTLRSRKAHPFPYPPGTHAYRAPLTTHLSGTTPQAEPCLPPRRPRRSRSREPPASFELEAVVSCTSDGLVVVLRKARPPIPAPHPPLVPTLSFENGLFAAPWGQRPIHPYFPPDLLYTFRPPLLPKYMPLRENVKAAGGPPLDQLMTSIRDVAVFAWALVGINGNIAEHAHGLPKGGTRSGEGLDGWDRATGSTRRHSRSENPGHGSWSQPDNERCQTRTSRRCHDPAYPTANTAPHRYNQTGQQAQEHVTYNGFSPWRSSSSLFNSRGYEQEHSRYQHHEQNQLPQNSTQHHHHYYHHHVHHHYHEQQRLPQQQPPFVPDRSLASEELPREPWSEETSSRAHRPQSRPIPSTQTPQQRYSNDDFRYKWQ